MSGWTGDAGTVFATLKLHKPALIHVGAGQYGPDGTTYEYHDWN